MFSNPAKTLYIRRGTGHFQSHLQLRKRKLRRFHLFLIITCMNLLAKYLIREIMLQSPYMEN